MKSGIVILLLICFFQAKGQIVYSCDEEFLHEYLGEESRPVRAIPIFDQSGVAGEIRALSNILRDILEVMKIDTTISRAHLSSIEKFIIDKKKQHHEDKKQHEDAVESITHDHDNVELMQLKKKEPGMLLHGFIKPVTPKTKLVATTTQKPSSRQAKSKQIA